MSILRPTPVEVGTSVLGPWPLGYAIRVIPRPIGLLALSLLWTPICSAVQAQTPTFNSDVAPILYRRCVACHRPGGSGPFPLITYEDARKRARQIAMVTETGFMPPWLPAADSPPLRADRRLSSAELATLTQWHGAGMPRGDEPAPRSPTFVDGWQLGSPDVVIKMEEAYILAAGSEEVFRNFVLSVPTLETRFVRAVELRVANPRVVHHAILTLDETDASRTQDRLDPEPGFDGMQAFSRARSPGGHFVGWTPGKVPFRGYEDMAWELRPGSDLVLETHMLPSGKEEVVRVELGLFFAEKPPSRQAVILRLGSKTIDIPAGESRHRVEDRLVLPLDLSLLGVYPHAHYLCREMVATATFPDGSERRLIHIESWDFNWQDSYRFETPIELPAGTEIRMVYVYDNSADNPRNPHDPPRRVVYGPSSADEMGDLWLQAVPRSTADLVILNRFLERRELEALIEGYRKQVADRPADAQARFNLGSELVRGGAFDQGIATLEKAIALEPRMTAAHMNLGYALAAKGEGARALESFQRVVKLDPGRAEGFFNLADSLVALGRSDQALSSYDRALALRPSYAAALLNKGSLLEQLDRRTEALGYYEKAEKARPGYAPALYNLAQAAYRDGDKQTALEYLERGVEENPWSVRLLVARGDILLELGELEAAAASYERALIVEPEQPRALVALQELGTH